MDITFYIELIRIPSLHHSIANMRSTSYLWKLIFLFILVGLSSSQSCPANLHAKVIIIGAGMAGISATQRLQESGISDILILEARDRIGGRVHSAQLGGVTVSLGATWIQGIDQKNPELHPLYNIAQSCGGLRGLYFNYTSLKNYNSQGNQPEPDQFRYDKFDAASDAAKNEANHLTSSGQCGNVTLRSALDLGNWTPSSDIDDWIEWFNVDYNAGAEPDNLSLCLHENDPTYTAFVSPTDGVARDYFVTDIDGFEKIIQCMADKAETAQKTRVSLSTVVTAINTSDSKCVCVTANSNGGIVTYCAEYVISTVSVGVLQGGSIQFIPVLPAKKREVIQRFEMTNYVHIIMQFTEAFWDDTEQIGYIDSQRGFYPIFLNYRFNYPEQPNILNVEVTGAQADNIARQSKTRTISEVEQILRTIYPTSNIEIVDSIVTDWRNDPLFGGTYIYYSADLLPGDHEALAAPVEKLYFSGSATSADFSGYVHGAYYAGRETAEKIIAKKKKEIECK